MTRSRPDRWRPLPAATLAAAWLAVLGMLGVSVGGTFHLVFEAHVLCPVDGQLHHVQPSDDLDGAVEESQHAGHGGQRDPAPAGHHGGPPSQPHSHEEAPCSVAVMTQGTPLVAGSAGLVQAPLDASATPTMAAACGAYAPISLQHLSPSHSPPS